jgi:hypothetical protein
MSIVKYAVAVLSPSQAVLSLSQVERHSQATEPKTTKHGGCVVTSVTIQSSSGTREQRDALSESWPSVANAGGAR